MKDIELMSFDELKAEIEKYGTIQVEVNPKDLPYYSMGKLEYLPDKGKFKITLREKIPEVLLHEFLHLLRDDLTVMSERKLDPFIWNIATDIVINEDIAGHRPRVREIGLSYETFKKQYPELPHWMGGAKPIYDYLIQQARGYVEKFHDEFAKDTLVPIGRENLDKAKEVLDETIRKVGDDVLREKLPKNFGKLIEKSIEHSHTEIRPAELKDYMKTVGKEEAKFEEVLVPPRKNPIITRLERIFKTEEEEEGEILTTRRLYRREGRVPELPREIEYPGANILFIIDVSGSMETARDFVLSAISYLRRMDIAVDLIYFSNSAKKVKGKLLWAGGGTNFSAALDLLEKEKEKYFVIVVISDYKFVPSDMERLPEIKKFAKHVIFYNENLEEVEF